MKYYAIGKPNKEIRMVITTIDEEAARAQLQTGEVYVEVDGPIMGKIGRNGRSVIEMGTSMALELSLIRERRTALLSASDYTVLPDSPFTAEQREAWIAYREALRTITDTQPNVMFVDIVWPVPPA